MFEGLSDSILVALIGLISGIILGLAARLGRFCTMGAIEDLLYGGSDTRMRMWILAIGIAIMGSFGLMASGHFDPRQSYYLSIKFMPVAAILGGLIFGYGMALAGNCSFGTLARLGGGDMRSFVIVLVIGVSAYATLYGPLAWVRNWLFPQNPVSGTPPGFAQHIEALTGLSASYIGLSIGAIFVAITLAPRHFHRDLSSVFWGSVVGLAITAGWGGSYWVAQNSFAAMPVVSHSYSAPMGETLMFLMTATTRTPSFAVGSVFGVVIGAWLGSLIKGQFRWEACEDPRELRRQIFGAALMGMGAVLALGCTIGQGLTAFSVLSLSAPLVFLSIFVGAALGLRQLITGFRHVD